MSVTEVACVRACVRVCILWLPAWVRECCLHASVPTRTGPMYVSRGIRITSSNNTYLFLTPDLAPIMLA